MKTNEWIKVTDRLPTEDGIKVLVTVDVCSKGDISLLYYLTKKSNDIAYSVLWEGEGFYELYDGDFYKNHDVIAWMPLPEPFKE